MAKRLLKTCEYSRYIYNGGIDTKGMLLAQDKRTAEIVAREIYAWGDEECPHVHKVFATRPKRACDICWDELKLKSGIQPKEGG
jgi:hypothetical protein